MKKIVISVILLSFFVQAEKSYNKKNIERSYTTKKVGNKLSFITEKKSKFYKNKHSSKFFNGKKSSIDENQTKLFRDHIGGNESKALGYWSEIDPLQREFELFLDVYDNQQIPHPGQVLGFNKSSGQITVDAAASGSFLLDYLMGPGQFASNLGHVWDEESPFPMVDIMFLNEETDSYVFRPDSIGLIIWTEEAWYDTTGELYPIELVADGKNVLINAGDPISYPDDFDMEEDSTIQFLDHELMERRIIHGITFSDTVEFIVPDSSYLLAGQTLKVSGSLKHEKIDLIPGQPINIVEFFDDFYLGGDYFVLDILYDDLSEDDFEFFSNGIGNQYSSYEVWEINGFDPYGYPTYEYSIETDTIPFYYTDFGDHMDIRQVQTEDYWDEETQEYVEYSYEETFKVGYRFIDDITVEYGVTDEFCYDEYNQAYSPYQCGDFISQFLPVYGLNGVSSLLLHERRTYQKREDLSYDYKEKNMESNGFNAKFPVDGTTININSFNAWTDTLKFIWDEADHLFSDNGDITYYPEVTGDLSKFFVLTGSTKETSWKFPYNQIKSNMSEAGINYAEGTWSIRAEAEVMMGEGTSPALVGSDAIVRGPVIIDTELYFDGTQDTVYITNVQNFENNDFSLAFLITTTQTESAGILLKSDGDGVWEEGEFHLYIQDGYITFVGFDNEYIKSTIQINDGNSHHVVITNEADDQDSDGVLGYTSEVKVYIDGQDATSTSSNFRNDTIEDANIADYPIMLGIANNSETFSNYEGFLANLAIYNVALDNATAKDISDGSISEADEQVLQQYLTGFWYFETITSVNGTKKIMSIKNKNAEHKLIIDATSLDIADNSAIPTEFKLHENYPNPFNPSTNIKFDIPENGLVSLIVYDLMGHKVAELVNTNMNSGFHNVSWNGTDNFGNTVSTGVYIYQLKTGNYSNTQKMLFIK